MYKISLFPALVLIVGVAAWLSLLLTVLVIRPLPPLSADAAEFFCDDDDDEDEEEDDVLDAAVMEDTEVEEELRLRLLMLIIRSTSSPNALCKNVPSAPK